MACRTKRSLHHVPNLVNHRLIRVKLKCYRITAFDINCIDLILSRRFFQVSVSSSLSHVAESVSDVTQGSV